MYLLHIYNTVYNPVIVKECLYTEGQKIMTSEPVKQGLFVENTMCSYDQESYTDFQHSMMVLLLFNSWTTLELP